MSTRNEMCPGCGKGELDASSGVIVYVCGTTVSQFGTNRSANCNSIETAALRKRITELAEHVARLEEVGDACAETSTTPQRIEWERVKWRKP